MADHPTICSRCDTANPAGAEFCGNCGRSLRGFVAALRGPDSGDGFQLGIPAAIGAVFVTLIALVWFVAFRGNTSSDTNDAERLPPPGSLVDDDADVVDPEVTPSTLEDVPGTTSPVPLPVVTTQQTEPAAPQPAPATTAPPAPTAPPPVTAAPDAASDAVPGDLGVADRPMQAPSCDDGYIAVVASSVGADATATGIEALLEQYAGSNYLRTDQTCPSLRPNVDGEPIYIVYLGPFPFASDACAARAQGPEGSYARVLSTTAGPDHSVECDEPAGDADGDADAQPAALTSAALDGSTPYVVPIADPATAGWATTHSGYPASDVFAQGCGATVVSPVEGVLLEVRRTDGYDPDVDNPATRGGRSISLLGDDGVRYYFAHFDRISAGLAPGGRVAAGAALGTVGQTGRSGACHLHLGISTPCPGKEWKVRRGVVWPYPYLDAWLAGEQRSPADEVEKWLAANPSACDEAMADEFAGDA